MQKQDSRYKRGRFKFSYAKRARCFTDEMNFDRIS